MSGSPTLTSTFLDGMLHLIWNQMAKQEYVDEILVKKKYGLSIWPVKILKKI